VADFDTVLAESVRRDEQDSTRADSPLMHDETYTIVDTSDLTVAEVVDAIVDAVRKQTPLA
jgi:cytidylate kinase